MKNLEEVSFQYGKKCITWSRSLEAPWHDTFENLVLHNLGRMAAIKQKQIRSNQSPVMNKDIHNAIMTRMRLRNRFLKEPTPMNTLGYKKQKNYCVLLMRENKKPILWFIA